MFSKNWVIVLVLVMGLGSCGKRGDKTESVTPDPATEPAPAPIPGPTPGPGPTPDPKPKPGPTDPGPTDPVPDPAPMPDPAPTPGPTTPVGKHGVLHTQGNQLLDQHGQPVQLKGVSSSGLQWYPKFMNNSAFVWLRDNWGVSVVRAAMYTKEGGYLDNPAIEQTLEAAVSDAVQAGIYVIIDWHILSEGDPMTRVNEATAFFTRMAQKYANTPNVLFEICNEPNGNITWAGNIRPYAEQVGSAIRRYSQGIIIVGSPVWSQQPNAALASPVDFGNAMYTMHFYAASHYQDIRDNLVAAEQGGLPVFVTEWAISTSSGDGKVDVANADAWLALLNQYSVSWTSWSLSDKAETSAMLLPGANPDGPFLDSALTQNGLYVKGKISTASSGCANPGPSRLGDLGHIDVQGQGRQYLISTPEYEPSKAHSLIIEFHGFGMNKEWMRQLTGTFEKELGSDGIFVYPNSVGSSWSSDSSGNDVKLFYSLVDKMKREYCVDSTRIFAVGYSNGAFFVNQLAGYSDPTLRGIIVVAGGGGGGGKRAAMITHGRSDSTVSFGSGRQSMEAWARVNGCTVPAASDDYKDGCTQLSGCSVGYPVNWCRWGGTHDWPPSLTPPYYPPQPELGDGESAEAAKFVRSLR